ncbi:MAG: Mov34/MPN/PAD-1 family protein [Bacillota bacterium]|jgi:proteasome lid subunit RPN8/RPN11|nr:Mov34/MPN/PAD-1 family protein [Bacillota bacterium]
MKMAKEHYPMEVGTSLIGYYSDDGFDAFICRTAPLPPDSKGLAHMFVRGAKGMRAFFSRLLERYSGKKYYVGEWHSHPDALAYPSEIDDINMSAISSDVKTNCPECILVILGENFFELPKLGVFVYSRTRGRIDLYPDG